MQVYGEHDSDFKQLNSQLLKECHAMDWTSGAGHASSSYQPTEVGSLWICCPCPAVGMGACTVAASTAPRTALG